MDNLDQIRAETLARIKAADSLAALEEARVAALGRKGRITEQMKTLGALAPEARREAGAALNRLQDEVAAAIGAAEERLRGAELERRLTTERVDGTLPVRPEREGRIHPISQT